MFKKLALTSLILLALKGTYGQSAVDSSKDETLPVIPIFEVKYTPSMTILGADGEVNWKSRYYKKDGNYIGEIKGEANIDVGFWPISTKVYVGFKTIINYTKNTIETITYNNGSDNDGEEKILSEFEKKIARRESIDTRVANDVALEFSDYKSGKLVDLENSKVIDSDSYGLQESYFAVRKKTDDKKGFKEKFKVHLKGKEYDIPVKDSVDEKGRRFLFVDLRVDDPANPGKKSSILEQINWLKIYNNGAVPYRVIAQVNTPIAITKELELNIKP